MLVDTVHMRVAAPYIPSAARTAHLLITAAINLVRVEVAPLPDEAALSPLAPLLAQQQVRLGFRVRLALSWLAAPWLLKLACCRLYPPQA